MKRVYLDNVAATRMVPEVLDAMLPWLQDSYGNPSSLHNWGNEAKRAVEQARAQVAALIGAAADDIIFTSSGSEANNLAVKGLALARQDKGKHIVVSAVEHFSVMHAARTLEKWGFNVTLAPADKYGVVHPDDVARSIRDDTVLVSVMHANSEVGTIEPVKEIARRVKQAGALFHTDAVASVGTVPFDVRDLGVDALSLAGGMFYGPKGAAALYLRQGTRIMPLIDGGIQEDGRRAGTENVAGIVGMGKAAELAQQRMGDRARHVSALRDRLLRGVSARIAHVTFTGHPADRLPGNASFCIEFVEGESTVLLLSQKGIAASTGSACTSRALKNSHCLTSMGVPPELAQGSMLFSIGIDNTEEDIDYLLEALPPIVKRLRDMSPLYAKFIQEGSSGSTARA